MRSDPNGWVDKRSILHRTLTIARVRSAPRSLAQQPSGAPRRSSRCPAAPPRDRAPSAPRARIPLAQRGAGPDLPADISDLTSQDWPHPTPARLLLIEYSCRLGRTSRPPPWRPAFRPTNTPPPTFLRHLSRLAPSLRPDGLLPPSSVSRSAPGAPRSAGASTRTGVGSGGSRPTAASSSGRA